MSPSEDVRTSKIFLVIRVFSDALTFHIVKKASKRRKWRKTHPVKKPRKVALLDDEILLFFDDNIGY
ncbi:MAG TPA: hypothetical protein DD376_01850 [Sutterella sp.]|nr:hypothetical protein [Sutterella sp.]